MKVEVAVLGSPSLIVRTVSVDVKQHFKKKRKKHHRAQELYEGRGGRPGLPVLMVPTVSVDVKQCQFSGYLYYYYWVLQFRLTSWDC